MGAIWAAPLQWPGETVFIVAGGTSVLEQDTEALRGRRVIAVNSSYERVPFADYCFFGDDRWWKEHRDKPALRAFAGRLITVSRSALDTKELKLIRMRRQVPNETGVRGQNSSGLATDRTRLVAQRTSMQGAMNLAAHFIGRGGTIVLLGADAGRGEGGRSHHHTPHKWKNKEGNKTWDIQMKQLRLIVKPLQDMGIAVINTSLQSRLPWWPKASLESVLRGDKINTEVVEMPEIKPMSDVARIVRPPKKKGRGYPGGIMKDDEAALHLLQARFSIFNLLEFGPGASTRIWLNAGVQKIISCEHDPDWLTKARGLYAHDKRVTLLRYNNVADIPTPWGGDQPCTFDAALVDSPQGYKPHHLVGGKSRFNTLRFALQFAPVVFLHDAKRDGEQASLAALKAEGYTVEMMPTYKGIAIIQRPGAA